MEITEVEIEHVRRRVEGAQGAVQRQRLFLERPRQALRNLHLHDVAVENVLLAPGHRFEKGLLADARARRVRNTRSVRRDAHRLAQAGQQFRQAAVRGGQCAGLARIGIHDEVQLAGEVVENRHLLGLQQHDVGRAQRVGLGRPARQLRFDIAHDFVAEHAHQSAGAARQVGQRPGTIAIQVGADEFQRVGGLRLLDHLVIADHLHVMVAHHQAGARRQADERIAAEALAAHHRFEQVAVGTVGELQVDGQRRIEIGEGLDHHGNAIETCSGKAVEF